MNTGSVPKPTRGSISRRWSLLSCLALARYSGHWLVQALTIGDPKMVNSTSTARLTIGMLLLLLSVAAGRVVGVEPESNEISVNEHDSQGWEFNTQIIDIPVSSILPIECVSNNDCVFLVNSSNPQGTLLVVWRNDAVDYMTKISGPGSNQLVGLMSPLNVNELVDCTNCVGLLDIGDHHFAYAASTDGDVTLWPVTVDSLPATEVSEEDLELFSEIQGGVLAASSSGCPTKVTLWCCCRDLGHELEISGVRQITDCAGNVTIETFQTVLPKDLGLGTLLSCADFKKCDNLDEDDPRDDQ